VSVTTIPSATTILLRGEETFRRDRRAREIQAARSDRDSADYNLDIFQGPDVDLNAVLAACETLPLLADRRVVVIRDIDLASAASHDGFTAYLGRPNPSTVMLVTGGSGGGRGGQVKGVKKLVSQFGHVEEFAALRPDEAARFVRDAAQARDVEIAPAAARQLVELVGADAGRLDSEIEKAAIYCGGRRIELADVELLAWRTRGHTMFELTDAIARGDRRQVLSQLGALFEDGNDALAIVGMVGWHMRRTLRAASMLETGARVGDVARTVGIHRGIAERFAETSARLGTRGTAHAIRALRRADRALKSTGEARRQIVERTLLEMLDAR